MEAAEIEALACDTCLDLSVNVLDAPEDRNTHFKFDVATLTRFAALIEAAAMEKAAKIAESKYFGASLHGICTSEMAAAYNNALICSAAAIRAAAKKQV